MQRDVSEAHPRVGGENQLSDTCIIVGMGSSPRGRGKLARSELRRDLFRLIPAWAGKTGGWCGPRWSGRAHPRVGGENQVRAGRDGRLSGSSPRGRGKRRSRCCRCRCRRLIPAWAGKTLSPLYFSMIWRAHPRVGGENFVFPRQPWPVVGSSPRGRGKRYASWSRRETARLIPAWAGKTARIAASVRLLGAHPRVGGENSPDPNSDAICFGSSPRGRGKLEVGVVPGGAEGLIPAWAGKTYRSVAPAC